ncbi:DUF4395 family protein [Microbispora sp. CA-102843]|uniref:DUF4395 family protein n=1 Tax=Microbispora sp. CA-102843 TaxID=3239952 RepID=UPI003D912E25
MQIDPRAPRSGAVVTTAVLAVALVTRSLWLFAAQANVFVLGAVGTSPYGLVFHRFVQAAGLGFAVVGLIGFAEGITALALGATAAALLAAFLNAAFGFRPGCETYLLIRRLQPGRIQ